MKMGTRLLIAGLLGIAVTGASTLAYFTSSATLAQNGDVPLSLNITNGTVSITAGVGDGATTPTWSYDVARTSTSTATYGLYGLIDRNASGTIDAADYIGLGSPDATYATYAEAYLNRYIIPNRSKDIVGVSDVGRGVAGAETNRYAVGASLSDGTITNARPGDALVLGDATGANEGIKITNTSSLTVKVGFLVNPAAATATQLTALGTAGWVMYINGVATPITTPESLQTALNGATVVVAPLTSHENAIKIRLELPLLTGDAFKGKSVSDDGVTPDSFDVSSLFTIVATQENNPGWTNAGN